MHMKALLVPVLLAGAMLLTGCETAVVAHGTPHHSAAVVQYDSGRPYYYSSGRRYYGYPTGYNRSHYGGYYGNRYSSGYGSGYNRYGGSHAYVNRNVEVNRTTNVVNRNVYVNRNQTVVRTHNAPAPKNANVKVKNGKKKKVVYVD